MKTEPRIYPQNAVTEAGCEGAPKLSARRRLFGEPPPVEPQKQAWVNVLHNLRSGSEDGIQNAMLLISAQELKPGPALACLQPPRPSLLSCKPTERREIEALLSAAIIEAEELAFN